MQMASNWAWKMARQRVDRLAHPTAFRLVDRLADRLVERIPTATDLAHPTAFCLVDRLALV